LTLRGALSQKKIYWVPIAATGCALATPAASGTQDGFSLRPGPARLPAGLIFGATGTARQVGPKVPIDASRRPVADKNLLGAACGHKFRFGDACCERHTGRCLFATRAGRSDEASRQGPGGSGKREHFSPQIKSRVLRKTHTLSHTSVCAWLSWAARRVQAA
jgi:hypothetical protein